MRSMRLQQLIESRYESLATKKEAQKKPMFAWELDFLYETLVPQWTKTLCTNVFPTLTSYHLP